MSEHLFSESELRLYLEERVQDARQEIEQIPEAEILARPARDIEQMVANAWQLPPLELHTDRMQGEDRGETRVWGPGGLVTQRVRVHVGGGDVPGRQVVVHVPFSGDPILWKLRPSTYGSLLPEARVEGNELLFPFEFPIGSRPPIPAMMKGILQRIKEPYLKSQEENLGRFNEELRRAVSEMVGSRRQRILEDREHLDGLGLPVYRRGDAPKTYAAPGMEQRPTPLASESAQGAPGRMEPVLVEALYSHIVEVICAMARGMERNPGDYASWEEEKLRDVLLVILNTHYEGQATGETFNKKGKTDILIRVQDRNVFVGECKKWKGAASFAGVDRDPPSALDQLLSYATWRDAKLALTVFVENKNMSEVISSARDALEQHGAFNGWSGADEEGLLRCRVKMAGEGERGADLAVIFVHLPKE